MQASNLTPYWFKPKAENKKKAPTRFKIKPLSAALMFEVLDDCDLIDGNPRPKKRAREALWENGIVDWENLKSKDESIPFSPENFDRIPFVWLQELTNEIFTASSLNGLERKN